MKSVRGTIGLGVIGCGEFGRYVVNAAAGIRFLQLRAVWSRNPQKMERAVAIWREARLRKGYPVEGDVCRCRSMEEVIQADNVDLVVVATPPDLHFPIAKSVLKAGKRLFLEKPGSTEPWQLELLAEIAKKSRIRATVDYVMRRSNIYRWIKALQDKGLLGFPEYISITNLAGGEIPDGHWFWNKSVSGGIWIEHGVHFFDLTEWIVGPWKQIQAVALTRPNHPGLEDQVLALAIHSLGDILVPVNYYHGFTRPHVLETTTVELSFGRGTFFVEGWIPVNVQAVLLLPNGINETHGLALPEATIRQENEYPGGQKFAWRGQEFDAVKLVRIEGPKYSRDEEYTRCIRRGLEELVDESLPLSVTLEDAAAALKLASAASKSAEIKSWVHAHAFRTSRDELSTYQY